MSDLHPMAAMRLRFWIGFRLLRLANRIAPNIIGGLFISADGLPRDRAALIAAYRKSHHLQSQKGE